MPHVYVTGHRNPDTDTIASAIGYAELKSRLNPQDVYAPARLGEVNAQTRWALKKSGAGEPKLLKHIKLRVKDVMKDVVTTHRNDPLRNVGLLMAKRNIGQVPIVDDRGVLVGIVTEKDLARMYIRESREASSFAGTPVSTRSMVEVLEGELLAGEDKEASGKLWVIAMSAHSMGQQIKPGDIVIIGDRPEGQRRAIELGAGILVVSNGARPEDGVLRLAEEKGTTVVLSSLDSYVTSRMTQLSVPCWEVMSEDPLTVDLEALVTDITPQVMEVHYRAAVAAVLSDTVIFNSPTTTERDREVVRYLEGLLDLDAREFGMEMFEASSDVSGLSAGEIVDRDLKEYALGDGSAMSISQIETVGAGLLERKDELLGALEEVRRGNGYLFAALMVTDIIGQGTELLCVGDCAPIEQAFDQQARDHVIDLPGVMSRKKQVAPKLLAAF